MSFTILGIGTATPPHQIEQSEAADWATAISQNAVHRSTVAKLYRRVGVKSRHSVLLTRDIEGVPAHEKLYLRARSSDDRGPTISARMQAYEHSAGLLAAVAAEQAFQSSGCNPTEITHLITVSCSGFLAPGLDVHLIRELNLSPHVQRTHVGFMGCHGAMNGLRVAKAFAESDPKATVLLCAVELCSLHHQYQGGVDQIVANALFADGAAAVIGRSARPDNGKRPSTWCLQGTGSTVIPETEGCMTWHIRDHGFQMGLSPQVPEVIERELRSWLENWLAQQHLSLKDVGCWAIHPGGPKILQACANALALPETALDVSQQVLAEYGNMSSPTVLFIVDRLQRAGRPAPCVMLAFGPGLTAEVALLTTLHHSFNP